MPVSIDPIKHQIVKKARLQGCSKSESLRRASYSKATIRGHSHDVPVVKRVDAEIAKEFKMSELTAESVLKELDFLYHKAVDDGDNSSAKGCLELLGKYLSLFKDRTEFSLVPTISYEDTNPELLRAKLERALNALPKTAENKQIDVTIDNATSNEVSCS